LLAQANPYENKEGFGAIVVPGSNYVYEFTRLNMNLAGGNTPTTIEFSDNVYDGSWLPGPDTIQLKLPGQTTNCVATSMHDRAYIGAHGPMRPNRGACRDEEFPATDSPIPVVRPEVADDSLDNPVAKVDDIGGANLPPKHSETGIANVAGGIVGGLALVGLVAVGVKKRTKPGDAHKSLTRERVVGMGSSLGVKKRTKPGDAHKSLTRERVVGMGSSLTCTTGQGKDLASDNIGRCNQDVL
jgi:hypothetical protein